MDKFLSNSSSSSSPSVATAGFSSDETSTKVLSWNIDSMTPASGKFKGKNKLTELLRASDLDPDIIAVQEIKVSNEVPPIDGFEVVASALCREKRAQGCVIYAKPSLNGSAIPDFDYKNKGRLVGARFDGFSLFCVYSVNTLGPSNDRRPKEQERFEMDKKLSDQVAEEHATGNRIVIAGDLNITMTMLDKGKQGGNLWGESHCDDISSPISRVESLCRTFSLEDTFRSSHPTLKVSRQTQTTSYASNSTFGKEGARLDYILASNDTLSEKITKEASDEAPVKKRKTEKKWWSNSQVFFGKGWRLSNESFGNGSDHLPLLIELH